MKLFPRCSSPLLLSLALCSPLPLFAQQTGTDDPTWAALGFTNSTVQATALQADGKLVTVGTVATLNGRNLLLLRLTPSGLLDTSFDTDGRVFLGINNRTLDAPDIVVDANGRIIVLSSFVDRDNNFNVTGSGVMLVRYLANGELDDSFGDEGLATLRLDAQRLTAPGGSPFAFSKMLIQPDGKLLVLGTADYLENNRSQRRAVLMRFDADGNPDAGFGEKGALLFPLGDDGAATDLRVAANGMIYFTGNDEAFSRGFIARLTPAGRIDINFGTFGKLLVPAGTRQFYAEALAIQQDGAIIVAGNGNNAPDTQRASGILLSRFSANGVLDTSFGIGGRSFVDLQPGFSPYSDHVTALALEPSGKILVAANRDQLAPAGTPALLRFLQNGQLDARFGDDGAFYPPGYATEDLEIGNGAFVLVRNQFLPDTGDGAYTVRKVITRTPTNTPIVNIAGGNRIITDTDGVPGEVVSLSASSRDTDGTIVSSRWLVEGLEVGRGSSIQALLTEGISDIEHIVTDNDGAEASDSVRYTVVAPTNPLPKIGGLSSAQRTTNSRFSFSSRDSTGTLITTAPRGQALSLMGYIFPQLVDVDELADIYVVAAAPSGLFMRNAEGGFVPWNGTFTGLVPAYENRVLDQTLRVSIFDGALALPGSYRLFVGYKRKDRNDVIYNAEAGLLEITP